MNFLEQATKVYKNKTGINKAGPWLPVRMNAHVQVPQSY